MAKKTCPICGAAVKGSKENNYFCDACNVIFTEKEVMNDKES